MWHNFWRPRWLLIWQIANFSPLTPRRFSSQDSKYPNMVQISQYGPNIQIWFKYGPDMAKPDPKVVSSSQDSKYPNMAERLQIFKYGPNIQIWAKYPNIQIWAKYPNIGKISKYGPNIQIWAKYSKMGQISKIWAKSD